MAGKYRLGMDGGGTATRLCAADETGTLLFEARTGAINLNGQSRESVQQVFEETRAILLGRGLEIENCVQIGVGAAGISNPAGRTLYEECLRTAGFFCPVSFFGDHESALAAAFPDCHGIVLIAGTGSICFGEDAKGNRVRSGGWGHLIDDGGSAYALARDMCSAIVRAIDGRGEQTCMTELLFHKMGFQNPDALIGWLYQSDRSKRELAAQAVLVEEAADKGDAAALQIEENAAEELFCLTSAVVRQLPDEKEVALRGGVLEGSERIRESLEKKVTKSLQVSCRLSEESAAIGALRLLQKPERSL